MPVGFSIAVAIIFIAGGIYCRGSKRLRTTSKCMLFFGCLMALVIWIEIKTNNRKVRSIDCEGCPSASVCGGKCADKAEGGEA